MDGGEWQIQALESDTGAGVGGASSTTDFDAPDLASALGQLTPRGPMMTPRGIPHQSTMLLSTQAGAPSGASTPIDHLKDVSGVLLFPSGSKPQEDDLYHRVARERAAARKAKAIPMRGSFATPPASTASSHANTPFCETGTRTTPPQHTSGLPPALASDLLPHTSPPPSGVSNPGGGRPPSGLSSARGTPNLTPRGRIWGHTTAGALPKISDKGHISQGLPESRASERVVSPSPATASFGSSSAHMTALGKAVLAQAIEVQAFDEESQTRIHSGCQTPRTGAQTPRTGAQTPRTGAQTPRTGAQTPRTGAQTPRGSFSSKGVKMQEALIPEFGSGNLASFAPPSGEA